MSSSYDRSFLFSYDFRGARYSLEIPAANAAEAQLRLACMTAATMDGEVKMTIPVARRPTRWFTRFFGRLAVSRPK